MSDDKAVKAPAYGSAALAITAAVGVIFVAWVAADLASRDPLPGRPLSEPLVTYVAMLTDLAGRTAALVGLAILLAIVAGASSDRLRRWAGRAGQAWLWAALLNTVANPAYVNGLGLSAMLSLPQYWAFQVTTPSSLAWLVSALAAVAVVVVAYRGSTRAADAVVYGFGLLAWIFVMVTGNVTIGAAHDWATDALTIVGLSLLPLFTGAVAVCLASGAGVPYVEGWTRSYHRAVLPTVVISGLGYAVVFWQQLAGAAPGQVFYGLAVSGTVVGLVVLTISWIIRQVRGSVRPAWLVADGMVAMAMVAVQTVEAHIPTPRFFVPQTIQINYLGYELVDAPTLLRLVGVGRPNLLWLVVVVAAVGSYATGVATLRRRGETWPVNRLLCWLAGWALVGYIAVSGLWEYSTVLYSWHMVVHMTVNMLIPVLLVLGGPLTLLSAAARSGLPAAVDGVVRDLHENRLLQRLMSPPVLWANYVGSLFLVYFTPLFSWLMRYHWAHQLMLVYFLLTGYFFFALIVGVDKQAWNLPYIVRLALVISIMPFHAIFAVSIMSAQTLIGEEFYKAIALPWVRDLLAEQNVAGQATWLLGEVPLLIVIVALSAQWFLQDRREAADTDRDIDLGVEDSYDAYNDMLAELAARDEKRSRS